jgi:hypothetical protein
MIGLLMGKKIERAHMIYVRALVFTGRTGGVSPG